MRRETIHHMGRRLPGWNYCRPAIYVITIVVLDRRTRPLGELRIKLADSWVPMDATVALELAPEDIEAKVEFSELGRAIFAHFKKIGEFTPEIDPLYCEIMPDHLHLVLHVKRELKRPLGNAIAGFKTGCETIFARLGGEGRLFAEGFVDEIVFRAGQLSAEFDYLHDNPRRLAVKRLFPELFKVVSELKVNLRLAPQGPDGQVAAPGVRHAPAAPAVGRFFSIGNRFLLARRLHQVQVSRAWFRYRRVATAGGGLKIARDDAGEPIAELVTDDYEKRRDDLLEAARRGDVLLSPCVSDGERQIAREALKEGLKLVTLQNTGFAPLQKPGGRYFDACAEGRLLMLAPAAWPHQVQDKPMTRNDAAAMNRICQWLSGLGAAEINYRGMPPADIDELALAAVKAEV